MVPRVPPMEPDQTTLLAPSPRECLVQDHRLYFLLNLVDELNLSKILIPAHDKHPRPDKRLAPRMLTLLLIYHYCVVTASFRKMERPCYESGFPIAYWQSSERPQPDQ